MNEIFDPEDRRSIFLLVRSMDMEWMSHWLSKKPAMKPKRGN